MQRRLFFRNAAGLFLAPAAMQFAGTASAATPAVSPIELPPAEDIISSFGWVTDIHYTTAPTHTIPAEDSIRVYSHSLAKLHQAIDVFNTRKLDFAIELGDFKDCTKTVDRELTIGFLQTVESAFRRYQGDRYHVMGNHDFDQISLGDYLANTNNAGDADGKTYYAFVKNGVKYIVLDACFNNDEGEHYSLGKLDWQVAIVPKMEMEWFRKELAGCKFFAEPFHFHRSEDGNGMVPQRTCNRQGTCRRLLPPARQHLGRKDAEHPPRLLRAERRRSRRCHGKERPRSGLYLRPLP